RALHVYGQRHQDHEHENLLQAGQDRAAEPDGDDAHGKGDVDRQGLQDAAGADPPDIDRAQQAGPQVRPAPDGDASLCLGMLEAILAQCHAPSPPLFPTPERVAEARRRVDRPARPTYIFCMAIHRLNLPGAPRTDTTPGSRQTASVTELSERAREVLRLVVES